MLRDFHKESFDIIIQGGQSNSSGSGRGNVADAYQPNDRVWFLNQDFTISMAQERVGGNDILSDFSLEFARRYIEEGQLEQGRSLLVIRAAVGGTGFADGNWGLGDRLFLQMLEMTRDALGLNSTNRLVAFLWHQGEHDSNHRADFDTHYRNLSSLVSKVRDEFGVPSLPFIAANLVQLWREKNAEICAPVIKAMRTVCAEAGNAAFVETDGLKSNFEELGTEPDGREDIIHFSRASLYRLGERYYEAFKLLKV